MKKKRKRIIPSFRIVIFIAGNTPFKTEIAPLIIMGEFQAFEYSKATAIVLVMLIFSFVTLFAVNIIQAHCSGNPLGSCIQHSLRPLCRLDRYQVPFQRQEGAYNLNRPAGYSKPNHREFNIYTDFWPPVTSLSIAHEDALQGGLSSSQNHSGHRFCYIPFCKKETHWHSFGENADYPETKPEFKKYVNEEKCIGCGVCVEVCPGNLIKLKSQLGKKKLAFIKNVRDCWGCTSCIKECPKKAISFFLGADIGGKGSTMTVENSREFSVWKINKYDGSTVEISINKKDSNKY